VRLQDLETVEGDIRRQLKAMAAKIGEIHERVGEAQQFAS
jgi:hypothetical protein